MCIGSFLNVCVFRLRGGDNILFPVSSRCPRCRHDLAWFDNIPVLSFLFLKARCRYCRKPISIQYPVVEIVTGLGFLVSSLSLTSSGKVVASYFLLSFLVLLVVSDIKWFILPHAFNNLFIGAGLVWGWWVAIDTGDVRTVRGSIEGLLALGALLWGLGLAFPKGLGGGDVKMAAGIGAWLGPGSALLAVMGAFMVGAVVTLPMLATGRWHRRSLLPFGPFMAATTLFVWFRPEDAKFLLDRMA